MSSLQLASVADALGVVEEGTHMVVAGEVAQVLGIAAACDLHQVDEAVLVAGAERWVRGGADGTPDIGEFVAAELGVLLGLSTASAMARIADVLNVRHRHPTLWAAVGAGEVRFHEAARVAQACVAAGLDAAACAVVDGHCEVALRMQPWSRVRGKVEAWILLADPAAAAEREARVAASRRVEVGPIEAGHCDLWGRLDAADGVLFDQALTSIAQTLPAEADLDVRRASAVGVLARQALGQAELPRTAEIIVRLDATAQGDDVEVATAAEVQRWGAALTSRLGDLLHGCAVTVRPILDPRAMAPSDAYEISEGMRRVLTERWRADAFPFGSRAARACQADHTIPFDHEAGPGHGQTHPDLMAPLSSFSHRAKTHGGWGCEQPIPGVLVWTTPHGWVLVTTPAGTVRVSRPRPREHVWWLREPPDWLDDPPNWLVETPPGSSPNARSRPEGCPILERGSPNRAGGTECALVLADDPGPAQPALALGAFLAV